MGLGASFNRTSWHKKGEVLSDEMRAFNNAGWTRFSTGADEYIGITGYGPNINNQRDPRFGRSSELPGEDPYLSGHYAAQMVTGGLADDVQRAKIQSYTDRAIAYLKAGAMLKSFTVWEEMLNGDVFPYPNYFHNITGSNDYDNFMRTNAPASFGFYGTFVTTPAVRRQVGGGCGL